MKAVALMSLWKTKNALRGLFTDPRKMIPFLLFFVLIAFSLSVSFFAASVGTVDDEHRRQAALVRVPWSVFRGVLFAALAISATFTLRRSVGDGLLAFGMSDVDYLFPSPISRRVVLAYRLPALTFGVFLSGFFLLYMYRSVSQFVYVIVPSHGHSAPPWWFALLALGLCSAIYFNIAMFLALVIERRKVLNLTLIGGIVVLSSTLGLAGLLGGQQGFIGLTASWGLNWLYYPCHLAVVVLLNSIQGTTDSSPLLLLGCAYLLSLVPMFLTNANFYGQSIESSEKMAVRRRAAKGGMAAFQASRATTVKYKATREYTVKPFGIGPGALAWAHLCAAGKRPFVNFIVPAVGGLACGVAGPIADQFLKELGMGSTTFIVIYASMGFMTSARTASEAAVRRRELIAPLPIKAWEGVMANLVVPWISMILFAVLAAIGFACSSTEYRVEALVGLGLVFPLRLASRMVLMYVLVLAYPDFEDKVQQLLGQGIYYLVAAPFVIVEIIALIPAFVLHSVWCGLLVLLVLEAFILWAMLALAGAATERAVATGEPVRLLKLIRRKA